VSIQTAFNGTIYLLTEGRNTFMLRDEEGWAIKPLGPDIKCKGTWHVFETGEIVRASSTTKLRMWNAGNQEIVSAMKAMNRAKRSRKRKRGW